MSMQIAQINKYLFSIELCSLIKRMVLNIENAIAKS